jgi:uncharacterized protein YdeI (YjbR/CyaY-like superfamily)
MNKNRMNPKVDAFFSEATKWRPEMEKLRTILLDCQLTEELKWSKPCYAFQESNVVVIQGFKAYCALLFFKGVLLKDPKGILVKTGENTRVGRQIRFTDVREIARQEAVLKAYIGQAIEVEKAGLKVDSKTDAELKIPEEFKNKLAENAALKAAFDALTPGRQRAYGFYFSAPKQSKTRESRIEKCTPQILKGKGLMDRQVDGQIKSATSVKARA